VQIGIRTSFKLAGQVVTKTSFMEAWQTATSSRQAVQIGARTSFRQAVQIGARTSFRQAVQIGASFMLAFKVGFRTSRSKQGHLLLDRSALKECFRHSVHGRIPRPSAGKSALPSTHNLSSSGTGD
jgi:hypothetical protein